MNPQNVIRILLSTAALALPSIAHADTMDPTNYSLPPAPAEAPTKPADGMPGERVALHIAPVFFVPFGSLADATQAGGGVFAGLDWSCVDPMNPAQWWVTMASSCILACLTCRLVGLVVATSAVKRNHWVREDTKDPSRSRLKLDTVSKLVATEAYLLRLGLDAN